MIRRTLLAAFVAVFAVGILSMPALAGHCPKDVRLIDGAVKMTKVSDTAMSKVKALRDKGNEQHQSGQHGASLATLHEAMKMLGVSH